MNDIEFLTKSTSDLRTEVRHYFSHQLLQTATLEVMKDMLLDLIASSRALPIEAITNEFMEKVQNQHEQMIQCGASLGRFLGIGKRRQLPHR